MEFLPPALGQLRPEPVRDRVADQRIDRWARTLAAAWAGGAADFLGLLNNAMARHPPSSAGFPDLSRIWLRMTIAPVRAR